MKAKVVFCPIMRHFGKTAFPLRFLPSCSSVWFAVFFFGFPPPELETSKMSITPNVKTIYGRQVQNKKYSEPEIRGDCSGTKFAREQLKIFASLTYEVSIKKILCSTCLSFIKVVISEIVQKQFSCLCFLSWISSLGWGAIWWFILHIHHHPRSIDRGRIYSYYTLSIRIIAK